MALLRKQAHNQKNKHLREVRTAFRLGRCRNSRGHREIEFQGTYRRLQHLYGPVAQCTGKITFHYYGTKVLSLDLDNRRITDFGYGDYSQHTSYNVSTYAWALKEFLGPAWPRHLEYNFRRWTQEFDCRMYPPSSAPGPRVQAVRRVFETFREGVPWCECIDGTWWFRWDDFDRRNLRKVSVYLLDDAIRFLKKDQNWRYWLYHWSKANKWTRRFIDPDAHRRWLLRERRRKKAHDLQGELPGVRGVANLAGR